MVVKKTFQPELCKRRFCDFAGQVRRYDREAQRSLRLHETFSIRADKTRRKIYDTRDPTLVERLPLDFHYSLPETFFLGGMEGAELNIIGKGWRDNSALFEY